jgi:glycosyltransferase involved in cell wall biosynthesis
MVYNAYLNRGGEDEVFEAESELLESRGHRVHRYRVEADELQDPSPLRRAGLAVATIWSQASYRRFRRLARELRPDVVHFHNTFPLISPAAYVACKREGLAVVQTLHNYRLLCPKTTLYRQGRVCEDCIGRVLPWPGVAHACYHDSAAQTGVIAAMLALHRLGRTWSRAVDIYITPSAFAKALFLRGGLREDHLFVKPNFVNSTGETRTGAGDYFLFAGRLVEHKGVEVLLEAWTRLKPAPPLRIAGDGPLSAGVAAFAQSRPEVEYLGRQPHAAVQGLMRGARALLFPSTWYETFGMTAIEAFAAGLPVIASNIGPLGSEIVAGGRTGWLHPPGDGAALAALVERAWACPEESLRLGEAALREYEAKYTPERNYTLLTAAYAQAMARSRAKGA